MTAQFTLAADGQGGTLIGDPPIAATSEVDSVTTASGNAINSGGGREISSKSTHDGDSQNLGSSALVADTTVTSGGFALVSSGGTGSATPTSGGLQAPQADTENETTISSRAGESVGSNDINGSVSGNAAQMTGRGPTNGSALTVSSGGVLEPNSPIRFGGTTSGSGERFHLSDIALGSNTTLGFSEDGNKPSARRPDSDSPHTAQAALLGQFAMAHVTSASNGHDGTLTGDPAIAAMSNLTPAATLGHHG